MGKKNRPKGIREVAQKAKSRSSIGTGSNEAQVQPGDSPKKLEPDEQPPIPTQQNELKDWETYERIPLEALGYTFVESDLPPIVREWSVGDAVLCATLSELEYSDHEYGHTVI